MDSEVDGNESFNGKYPLVLWGTGDFKRGQHKRKHRRIYWNHRAKRKWKIHAFKVYLPHFKASCRTGFSGRRRTFRYQYPEFSKKMAVVAQHNYYNFDFSVMEVVLMGRAPHKKTMERDNAKDFQIAQKALETVEMEGFANRSFSTLSGGEQQRVILARALAQQTPCLILDEPTNHLDITHQIQLMKIVKNLKVTVISAVHDLNIAAMFCDRLYVLQDGEIVGQELPRKY